MKQIFTAALILLLLSGLAACGRDADSGIPNKAPDSSGSLSGNATENSERSNGNSGSATENSGKSDGNTDSPDETSAPDQKQTAEQSKQAGSSGTLKSAKEVSTLPYDGIYPQHEPYGTGIGAMPGRVV